MHLKQDIFKAVYDRLRQIPNINKVYDLMKLVYSRRLSKVGTEDPDGLAKDTTLTTWIQKIRGS